MGKIKLLCLGFLIFFFAGSSCNINKRYQRALTKYNRCFSTGKISNRSIALNGYYSIPLLVSGEEYIKKIFFSDSGFVISGLNLEDVNGDFNNSGVFDINQDTITTLEFTPSPTLNHKGIFISKYLIIDSNTIQEIYGYSVNTNEEIKRPVGGIGRYTPMQETPDLRKFWLLQQKWFWCDEERI